MPISSKNLRDFTFLSEILQVSIWSKTPTKFKVCITLYKIEKTVQIMNVISNDHGFIILEWKLYFCPHNYLQKIFRRYGPQYKLDSTVSKSQELVVLKMLKFRISLKNIGFQKNESFNLWVIFILYAKHDKDTYLLLVCFFQ